MSFVLYYSPLSPPSRAVKTLLLLSKTPYQEKIVDLSKGEHKTAEYERINPNQSVPALVHGSMRLFESHAILKYISLRRGLDQYYPKNLQNRAKVDCYLDWSQSGLESIAKYVNLCFLFPMMRKTQPPQNQDELHQDAVETLEFFENTFLKGSYILNQPSMTLADIKATADLTTLLITGLDFNQHPRIRDYLQKMLCQQEFRTAYHEYFELLGNLHLNESIKFIISGVDTKQNWKTRLYYHPFSPPSRSARTLLMITGVDYIEKIITLSKGEHTTPEFTLINPNQSVPAIQDGDLNLFESGAIMKYISIKYLLQNLYPIDAEARAKVDQYLDFHLTEMKSIGTYAFSCFIGPLMLQTPVPANKEEQLKDVNGTLDFFVKVFLKDGRWNFIYGSPVPTLADIRACCDLAQLFVSDFVFDVKLQEYLGRVFQLQEMQRSHSEFFQLLQGMKLGPFINTIIKMKQIKPVEKLIFYWNSQSPSSNAARVLLIVAHIPFVEKDIDLQSGENAKPPYTNINPNQSVPALSCGDFNLFESHAIMKFICIKYNLTQFYPNYPMRAKIDQYLDFHLTSMKFISTYATDFFFGPKFMKRPMPPNKEQRLIELNEGLQFFVEVFLGGGQYKYIMGSNQMTIADFSFIAEAIVLFFINFDFSPYPVLKEYLRNMYNFQLVRKNFSKLFLMARFIAPSMNPYVESIIKGTQEGQNACCQLV